MAGLTNAANAQAGNISPEFLEGAEEAVDEFVEGLFPPKPGGLVDRHRQREARKHAQEQQEEDESQPITQEAYKAIKVAPESPENYSGQTFTIGVGGSAQILGNISQRFKATILVQPVSGSTPSVLLGRDTGAVIGGVGFTLPAGIPMVVNGRGQLWAGVPSTASDPVTVSVLSEFYSVDNI